LYAPIIRHARVVQTNLREKKMTNENTIPQPKKKGLGALGWIAIGCGGLLLIGFLIFAAFGIFVGKKSKEFAGEFEGNPAMVIAEKVVQMNPDLELVDSDESDQTLTILNKKTGEVATVNFEDIKEGRFSFSSGDKTVSVDAQPDEGESGVITVSGGDEGETETLTIGGAGIDDKPVWVPIYPGTDPQDTFSMTADGMTSGAFSAETPDSVSQVMDYFAEELESMGFKVGKTTFSGSGGEGGMITTEEADGNLCSVAVSREGSKTNIMINYKHPQ